MLNNYPITIFEKKFIAENTAEITFEILNENFSFVAGQYVSIEIPSLSEFSIPDRCHDFSVVSSPSNTKEISIAFRVSKSIFKTALMNIPIGGTVKLSGPKGIFTLPESKSNVPLVFVAGGIGITPFLSMIRYATETLSSQKIILLYCNSSKETTAYKEELTVLTQKNSNFTFYESLGIPDKKLFEPYIKSIPNAEWCIVGSLAMVKNVNQILLGFDILNTRIKIEEFSGYEK